MLYGPNTNVGSNSVIFMLEAQAHYIVRALKHMRRRRQVVHRGAARRRWPTSSPRSTAGCRARCGLTRCSNYFRAANGRVVTQWPRSARDFWGMTRRFRAARLHVRAAAAARPTSRSTRPGVGEAVRTAALRSPTACDPALRHFAEARTDLSPGVAWRRAGLAEPAARRDAAMTVDTAGVEIERREVRVEAGRVMTVRIYRGGPSPAPAVIYCHGGAFVLGNLDTDHRQCVEFARRAQCTVVSVDYRLAPEHPYPAGFDDALAVLEWVAAEADGARHRRRAAGGRGQQRRGSAGGRAGSARRRRVGAAGCFPDAASAGARRPADPVEGGVHHHSGVRRTCRGADVAALLAGEHRCPPRPCPRARGRVGRAASGIDHLLGTRPAARRSHRLRAATDVGRRAPPNCTSSPAPATDSTRWSRNGRPARQLFAIQGAALRRALHCDAALRQRRTRRAPGRSPRGRCRCWPG